MVPLWAILVCKIRQFLGKATSDSPSYFFRDTPRGAKEKQLLAYGLYLLQDVFEQSKAYVLSRCFFCLAKRDFLVISGKTIYEDSITWTIPSLNFSFVDKRLKIPNLFVWTRQHYCMLNCDSIKLGTFKEKIISIG